MKTSLVLIAATALALPVVPAMAQNASVSVPYADLDLSSPEGRATLDKRIDDPVELYVGTRLIARGEVVVVDEDFGLRITEILDQSAAV